MVFVAILPMTIYLYLDIFITTAQYKREADKTLLNVCDHVEDIVKKMLMDRYTDLKLLARNPLITSTEYTTEEKINEMRKVQDYYQSFDDITMIDLSGTETLSTTYSFTSDPSKTEWFKDARDGKPVITSPYFVIEGVKLTISFFVPVYVDEKVVSVLIARMDVKRIYDIVDAESLKWGETGYIIILNKYGNIIYHPDRSMIYEYLEGFALTGLYDNIDFAQTIYFTDKSDIDYVGALKFLIIDSEVLSSPLMILAVQSKNEAYALSNYIIIRDLLQLVASASLIILISIYFSKRLTRPIETIIDGTRRVSQGEFGVTIDIKSWEEIDSIVSAFNRMSGYLKNYTEELKKSEEKYRTLVEDIHDGYFMLEHGRIVYHNDATTRITGYETDEIIGRHIADFYPEETRAVIEKLYLEILEEKDKTHKFEFPFARKDGKEIFIELRPKLISSVEEEIVAGIMVDISTRKAQEDLLREYQSILEKEVRKKTRELAESEEKFRNIYETSPDVIYIFTFDGRVIDINPAATDLFGYTMEELLTLDARNLYADEKSMGQFQEKIEKNEFARDYELTLKKKDGTIVDCIVSAIVLKDTRGSIVGYQGTIKDITARKKMETDVKNAKERLQVAFDAVSDRLYIVDSDYNLKFVNKRISEELKQDYRNILKKKCYSFFNTKDEPCEGCPLIRIKGDHGVVIGEVFVGNGDKNTYYSVAVYPILSEESAAADYLVYSGDITEEKKMAEKLIQSDRLISLGQLSAGIAHEIRNPLTAILGYANILLRKSKPEEQEYRDLKTIEEQANRCRVILEDLLLFSSARVDKKQYLSVNEVLESVIMLLKKDIKDKYINLERIFQKDMPPCYGDQIKISQVFLNILNNAIYAVDKQGTITVETSWDEQEDAIRMAFIDDGHGISDEDRKRLFDPFFTTKPTGKGTGLGLSVSYGIISEHGGELFVESTKGRGAKFVIVFPLTRGNLEEKR